MITAENFYIDRTAFMSDGFGVYLKNNLQNMLEKSKCLYMHNSVKKELKAAAENGETETAKVQKMLDIISIMKNKDLLKFFGNELETLESEMQYVGMVIRCRAKYPIHFITNSENLAEDIALQNQLTSYSGYDVHVYHILDNGQLQEWFPKKRIETQTEENEYQNETQKLLSLLGL